MTSARDMKNSIKKEKEKRRKEGKRRKRGKHLGAGELGSLEPSHALSPRGHSPRTPIGFNP
jgi:hypothetical protein